MDILRRSLAPISNDGWGEIDDLAKSFLKSALTARFMVDVEAPKGWEYQAVTTGRLGKVQKKGNVSFGMYEVKPLVELRVPFELNIWELDNATRGAKDVELDAVEKAAEEIAQFEDQVIFEGLKEAGIQGLMTAGNSQPLEFPKEAGQIATAVSAGISQLMENGIEGPYNLAVPMDVWQKIKSFVHGMPLEQHLEKLLGGELFPSRHLKNPILVSARGGDFEMNLGQDLSIGYSSHTAQEVSLFFTESFTFQIFEPRAVVVFK